jgi:hypothetical protein
LLGQDDPNEKATDNTDEQPVEAMQEDYIDDEELKSMEKEHVIEPEVPEGGLRNCPQCKQPMVLAARLEAREMVALMAIAALLTVQQALALFQATVACYEAFLNQAAIDPLTEGIWKEHRLSPLRAEIVLALVEAREEKLAARIARAATYAASTTPITPQPTAHHSGAPPPRTITEAACIAT